VRWDELFADLEGQAAADEAAGLAAEVADRTRREVARLRLVDRLRAAADDGAPVVVAVAGLTEPVHGRVGGVGPDWVLLDTRHGEALVALASVRWVEGLTGRARDPGSEGVVAARLGLTAALRVLARDRAHVRIVLVDGSVLGGTVDRVGHDAVDVAVHPDDVPRRSAAVRVTRVVPVAAVAVVRAI